MKGLPLLIKSVQLYLLLFDLAGNLDELFVVASSVLLLAGSVWVRGQGFMTLVNLTMIKVMVPDLLLLLRGRSVAGVRIIMLIKGVGSLPIDKVSGSLLHRLLLAEVILIRFLELLLLLLVPVEVLVEVLALVSELVLHDLKDVSMG